MAHPILMQQVIKQALLYAIYCSNHLQRLIMMLCPMLYTDPEIAHVGMNQVDAFKRKGRNIRILRF